jgi:hypothetical protein
MMFELCKEFDKLNLRIVANTEVMEMEVDSTLLQDIQKGQLEDEKIQEIKHNIKKEKSLGFTEDNQGVLWYKRRICVPNVKELKDKILHEAHKSAYSIHPGRNKMYQSLDTTYQWYGIKRDVKYVTRATPIKESKLSRNGRLNCCNPHKYLSGCRKRLLWILSLDCLGLSIETIPFG